MNRREALDLADIGYRLLHRATMLHLLADGLWTKDDALSKVLGLISEDMKAEITQLIDSLETLGRAA